MTPEPHMGLELQISHATALIWQATLDQLTRPAGAPVGPSATPADTLIRAQSGAIMWDRPHDNARLCALAQVSAANLQLICGSHLFLQLNCGSTVAPPLHRRAGACWSCWRRGAR